MDRLGRLATAAALVALAAAACAPAQGPSWTYGPAAAPASPDAVLAGTGTGASPAPSAAAAAVEAIDIEAFDLGFKPTTITVPAAGTYPVTFHNTGLVAHDVTFDDGTKLAADPGATVSGEV